MSSVARTAAITPFAVRCSLAVARGLLVRSPSLVALWLPNGLPMCRRHVSGERSSAWLGAVGTIGLLDMLNADGGANVAVPTAAIGVGRSLVVAVAVAAVVAPLVVTLLTRRSPLVGRNPLSVVRRRLPRLSRPNCCSSQGAARRSPSYLTACRCAAASGAVGWRWVEWGRSAPSAC